MATVDTSFANLGLDRIGQTTASQGTTQSADRFLKMLVTQMQNQDPLNPMDNAQITSQMAQINAVSGLEQVNESVKSLSTQLSTQLFQLQALQGAALVGREVMIKGDRIAIADGRATGDYVLDAKAGAVRVEALGAGDRVIASVELGPQDAGRHRFDVSAGTYTEADGVRFRIVASSGDKAVGSQTLVREKVTSVATQGGQLMLTLERSGTVSSDAVVTFN